MVCFKGIINDNYKNLMFKMIYLQKFSLKELWFNIFYWVDLGFK